MIDLPVLEPDAHRNARTVARCRQRLGRRRSYTIERALVAAVSVVYLIAMAADVVGIYR